MSLLVLGTVAYDAIETPFGTIDRVLGGAAYHCSLAASFFTKPIQLVSVVGSDYDESILAEMRHRGIDLLGLQRRNDTKSFFWAGRYGNDLNTRETLATELNALVGYDPILPEEYRGAKFVFLGNLAPSLQARVLDQLERQPTLIGLDTMNYWMDSALPELLQVIERVHLVTVNDEEARQLTGEYSLVKAARKIRSWGPRIVVIKKGEHGALLFVDDEQLFFAPALPIENVFDPTGAGDVFAGGMMGYLAANGTIDFHHLQNAVMYGSTMASFCVEQFGSERLRTLQRNEIRERYLKFRQLTAYQVELMD
jgi:sugar/nucleoside kinase (ribokinase family)